MRRRARGACRRSSRGTVAGGRSDSARARPVRSHGVFLVGNAAGEAHPAIAEGITIALQSAWMLSTRLISWRQGGGKEEQLGTLTESYRADWERHFRPRLHLSALVAHWAMHPVAVAAMLPVLRWRPNILTWFAQLSGKAHTVVRP